VRGWNIDGGSAAAIPGVSFLAYGTNKYGVNVSCGDVDGDGMDEIITAPGPSGLFGAHIRGWNYDGGSLTDMPEINFFAWQPSQALHGAWVFAGADVDNNGRDDLLVGAGPDPGVEGLIKAYRYDGGYLSSWFSFTAYPSDLKGGASVAAGNF
jgi:hypothetical protein